MGPGWRIKETKVIDASGGAKEQGNTDHIVLLWPELIPIYSCNVSRFLNSGTFLISGGTNDFLEEWEMDEIGTLTFIKGMGLKGLIMVKFGTDIQSDAEILTS